MTGVQSLSQQSGQADCHSCPICSKSFGRKDLRDRHRRRCEKSIGQVRQVKKKACERCVASKVKCGYEKPSCSRCLSRSVLCEYKLEPRIRMPAGPSLGLKIATGLMGSSEQRVHDGSNDEVPGLLPSYTEPIHGETIMAAGAVDPSFPWLPQTTDDHRTYAIGLDDSTNTPFIPLFRETIDDSWMSDLLSPPLLINPTQEGSVPVRTTKRGRTTAPANTRENSSLSTPLPPSYRIKPVIRDPAGSTTLSELAMASPAYNDPVPPGMIGLEEALVMISGYPLRMLCSAFRSPFLHPRLCQNSPKGGMPEPLAVALACVGMKLHSEQSGLAFVCDTIRDQRDKLIKELPSLSDSHEQVCAALHAMCIYDIEGLLSESRYHSKLNTAVLHHEYLVRATRRLLGTLQATTPSLLAGNIQPNTDWDKWAVQESLRRTILLVVMIHQLLAVTRTLDAAYFEPLLLPELMEVFALPCGDNLWFAESAEEWKEIRLAMTNTEETDKQPLTLGDAIRRLGTQRGNKPMHGVDCIGGLDGLGLASNGDSGLVPAELPELTRLIVSVMSIRIQG